MSDDLQSCVEAIDAERSELISGNITGSFLPDSGKDLIHFMFMQPALPRQLEFIAVPEQINTRSTQ